MREATGLVDTSRFREAVSLLEASSPEPESRILLGRAYLGLGRYADAEVQLASQGPDSAEPARLEAFSRAAEARGDLDRAVSMMTEAVEARRKLVPAPDDLDGASLLANSRSRLGQLAFRAGRLDLAKDQFQKAIALVSEAHAKLHALDVPHDERDPRLYAGAATSGLARVYAAQGNAVRADRSWRGVTARTDDPEILADLAAFYRARGDEKSARRHLDRALGLTAGKTVHRRIRALLLAGAKATQDEALALAEAAYADAPDLSSIDTLAWVLHLRGDDGRAAQVLAPAIRLGTKDPTILYHAGMIARAQGKSDEAKRLLSGSLGLNPAFDPIAAPDARRALDQLR